MTPLARPRARQLLTRMAQLRPLVVGDLMLDEYLAGDVSRISPEAPVPVVHLERETFRPGGAGNVAANASALGSRPLVAGLIGDDEAGRRFAAELERLDVDGAGLIVDPTRPTTRKTRLIARNQQVLRYDRERSDEPPRSVEDALLEVCLDLLSRADLVILSDYAKGCLTGRLVKEILAAAGARGLAVVVDPKVASFTRYQPVTALTPNHHEAARAAALADHGDDASSESIGRELLTGREVGMVLITRGEAGMTLVERDGPTTHLGTVAREVFDVTGAGDTVSATFALALAAGGTPVEAADLSNHAAGVVVGKLGATTASPDELETSLPAPA